MFVDPDGLIGWTDLGAILLGGAAVTAGVAGLPIWVPIALIGGAVALKIYGPSEAVQTIDNSVDRFKNIPGVKEHLDAIDKAGKLLKDTNNRLMGCPLNE